MSRIRSILLSGLVALLMVGMVNAGEVSDLPPDIDVTAGISIYLGTWNPGKTACLNIGGMDCLTIGIDIDIEWLKNLFL